MRFPLVAPNPRRKGNLADTGFLPTLYLQPPIGARNVREGRVLKATVPMLTAMHSCSGRRNRPKPMEHEIKPPSQPDDSARPYRDTKLGPSKTGAKSSQQFRSSSRTKVSRPNIRRWLPI